MVYDKLKFIIASERIIGINRHKVSKENTKKLNCNIILRRIFSLKNVYFKILLENILKACA